MKLIIDIDEETYRNVINTVSISFGKGMDNETISDITSLCRAVKLSRVYEERPQGENKIIELFNKYDILLVHIDGKIVPVKNSTKQECYELLYEIQELIEWRKLLFNKHLSEVYNGKEETT